MLRGIIREKVQGNKLTEPNEELQRTNTSLKHSKSRIQGNNRAGQYLIEYCALNKQPPGPYHMNYKDTRAPIHCHYSA